MPPIYEAPTIVEMLADVECDEGEPSHFQAMVSPTNDPNLQITWLRNGQPLAHGSKYAITNDFGFCTLDIGYTYPEDQVWLRSRNCFNDLEDVICKLYFKNGSLDTLFFCFTFLWVFLTLVPKIWLKEIHLF